MLDLFKNIIKKSKKDKDDDSQQSQAEQELRRQLGNVQKHQQHQQLQQEQLENSYVPPVMYSHYYGELSLRYQLIEQIGEGAFSKVFKAYDSQQDLIIAIKIIDKAHLKTEQINSVLKEISIMSKLQHENITKLYGHQNTTSSKYCFLFLENVDGGEIFNQIIRYTYFSEDLARHIIRQVAKSVKYLHDNCIVHRDIKPENLLFIKNDFLERSPEEQYNARRKSDDSNKVDEGSFLKNYGGGGIGQVKLADFGLSTVLFDDNMKAKTPCGTVGYTSPEQHLNLGYTKKVDIWAIGCVLYTLVVGFPPFYSNTQDSKDISLKVSKGDYKFLSPWFDEVTDECKNLITNLLTVDPEKRYSIDQLLKDPWMLKGYEDEDCITPILSTAAEDAPELLTFDHTLYTQLNDDLIKNNNIGNYFNQAGGNVTTPRAEAIKLVFDTGNVVQRATSPMGLQPMPINKFNNNAKVPALSPSGLTVLTEEDAHATIDMMTLGVKHKRRNCSLSESELSSDMSDDDEYEDDDDDEEDYDYENDDDAIDDEGEDEMGFLPPRSSKMMISCSPSYKSRQSIQAGLRRISVANSFDSNVDQVCSIVTGEIEDSTTGSRRKSSISFQLNNSAPSKSSRCGSITSSLQYTLGQSTYPTSTASQQNSRASSITSTFVTKPPQYQQQFSNCPSDLSSEVDPSEFNPTTITSDTRNNITFSPPPSSSSSTFSSTSASKKHHCYPKTPQPSQMYSDFMEEDEEDSEINETETDLATNTPCCLTDSYTAHATNAFNISRPKPTKKYTVDQIDTMNTNGCGSSVPMMAGGAGVTSEVGGFTLSLGDSTILSRRKLMGSVGCGPKEAGVC